MERPKLSSRTILVVLVIAVVEVSWAALFAVTGANLLAFYAGLVVFSVPFFLPGVAERSERAPIEHRSSNETKR